MKCIYSNYCKAIVVFVFAILLNNSKTIAQASALNFDGSDDYIDLPNSSLLSNITGGKVSASVWVYMNSKPEWGSILKNWGDLITGAFHLGLDAASGKMSIYISQGNGVLVSVVSTNSLSTGAWHNIAFTADGTNLKLYEDGVLAGTSVYDGTLSFAPATYIGVKPNDAGTGPTTGVLAGYWDGAIDEVRIWNRGLAACEINASTNCELVTPQTGLIAYYKFNQGVAGANNGTITSLADATANAYNGTLNNFTLTGTSGNWIAAGGVNSGTTCGALPVPTTSSTSENVCSNKLPFVWNGNNYSAAGNYTVHLTNAGGCDSAATLTLNVIDTSAVVINQVACNNMLPYSWNGNNYNTGGTYTWTGINSGGCDSVVVLNLTVNDTTTSTTNQSVCNNMLPYSWNGNTYNTAGIYTWAGTNAAGCDSVANLILNILDTSAVVVNQTVCNNMLPYVWNGNNYNTSGTYTWIGANAGGCDSVVLLNLTINDTTTSVTNQTACGSYSWNGNTYNTSGTYTWAGTNAAGCDSIAILNLSILTNITSVDIINSGAHCGDTVQTQLSTNISSAVFGSVTYSWSKLDYDADTWSIFSSDSVININDAYPTQYVAQVNIAGCGTFYSNQKMVMPVTKPNINLTPSPVTSICNNNVVGFSASSTDVGLNTYAFYKDNTLVQKDTVLTYTTPVLTTANDGVVYKVEATNNKPVFDGSITENFWGKPLAVSTSGPTPSFGAGHELNAVYARSDNDNLYLAIAGNVQNSNRIMVFIDSKTGGYNTGNYGRNNIGNQAIKNFNSGSNFDPGFDADYCLGIGTDAGRTQFYCDLFTLSGTAGNAASGGPNNYIGSNLSPTSGYSIGANPANATQTQGFEFAIPKSALGYTTGDIRIFVLYSADNGFLSNQFLTRANPGSGSYGNGIVNFGAAKPGHITIPVESLQNLCTSVAATTVTVKPNLTSTTPVTVCNNMLPYQWGTKQYTVSGTYNDTALGSNGCDSIATLVLTVTDTTTSATNMTVCNNMLPYSWNGNSYSTAGVYMWAGTNAAGCDSIATLNLTISDTTTFEVTTTSCDSINWGGTTYYTSGTYVWKGTNAAGCDSTATVNVTISTTPAAPAIIVSTSNVTVPATGIAYGCTTVSGAVFYNWAYTGTGVTIASGQGTENITADFAANATDGDMQVTASNLNGCTSPLAKVVLTLPIVMGDFNAAKVNSTVVLSWNSISEVNAREYLIQRSINGRDYDIVGSVTAKGFASDYRFVDNNLPVSAERFTVYYKLKQVDKDGKYNYSVVRQLSIVNSSSAVSIYPNPAKNFITISAKDDIKEVRILNQSGQVISKQMKYQVNGKVVVLNTQYLPSAMYFVEVLTKNGEMQVEKFMKE